LFRLSTGEWLVGEWMPDSDSGLVETRVAGFEDKDRGLFETEKNEIKGFFLSRGWQSVQVNAEE